MPNLSLNRIAEIYHAMVDDFLDAGDIHRALGAMQNGFRLSMDPEFLLRQLDLYIEYNAFPQALDLALSLLDNPAIPPDDVAGSLVEIYSALMDREAADYWRGLYVSPEIESSEQAEGFLRAELRKLNARRPPPEGWHLIKPFSSKEEIRRLEEARQKLLHAEVGAALEILDTIPDSTPGVSDAYALRAVAALASANPREADRILRSCPEKAFKTVHYLTTCCSVSAVLGQKSELSRTLGLLDKMEIRYPYEDYKVALCLAEYGRFSQASEHLLRFLDYAPFDREGLLVMGQLYLNLGRTEDARLCFFDLNRAGGGVPAKAWLVYTDHLLAEGIKKVSVPCRSNELPSYYTDRMEALFRQIFDMTPAEILEQLADRAVELLNYLAYASPDRLFRTLHFYDANGLPACLLAGHLLTDGEVSLSARVEVAQYMLFTGKSRFSLSLDNHYHSLQARYPEGFGQTHPLFRRAYAIAYMAVFLTGRSTEPLQKAAEKLIPFGPPPRTSPTALAAFLLQRSAGSGKEEDFFFRLYGVSAAEIRKLTALYGPASPAEAGKPEVS